MSESNDETAHIYKLIGSQGGNPTALIGIQPL